MKLILKPHLYGKRIGQYSIMAYSLDRLYKKGKLKEDLLQPQMSLIDEIYSVNPSFNTEIIKEEFDKNLKKLKEKAELEARKDVENYLPSIMNQVLVTACTILDTYLVDCLSTIIEKEPKILKGLADKDDITIARIIDAKDYSEIFKELKNKTLARFDFMGIKDKVSYLTNKIKIDVAAASLLPNHVENIQKDFPKGIDTLFEAYQRRNDIVHRDMQRIKTYSELIYFTQYMQIFCLELAFSIYKNFRITSDFMESLSNKN